MAANEQQSFANSAALAQMTALSPGQNALSLAAGYTGKGKREVLVTVSGHSQSRHVIGSHLQNLEDNNFIFFFICLKIAQLLESTERHLVTSKISLQKRLLQH